MIVFDPFYDQPVPMTVRPEYARRYQCVAERNGCIMRWSVRAENTLQIQRTTNIMRRQGWFVTVDAVSKSPIEYVPPGHQFERYDDEHGIVYFKTKTVTRHKILDVP